MKSNKKREIIAFLLAVISFLAIQFVFYNITALSKGVEIIGTDTYMRLVRIEEYQETLNWFDSVIERSNSPFGEELHWTRGIDLILYLFAIGLSVFVPFSKALYFTGIWLSPILGCIALYLLIWVGKEVIKSKNLNLIFLVFLTQPILFEIFNFGRPDHHSLLLLLFVVVIGCMVRVVKPEVDHRILWLAGVVLALSIWVSVEAVMLVGTVFIVMSILWIIDGGEYLQRSLKIAKVFTVSSALLLFVERPVSKLFSVEYDKISIVYIVFFLIVTAIFHLTQKVFNNFFKYREDEFSKSKVILIRFMLLLFVGTLGAVLMIFNFPDFIKGPFADVNPEIGPIWLNLVSEVQPMFSASYEGFGKLFVYFGIPTVSFIYLCFRIFNKKEQNKPVLIFLLVGMIMYGMLSLYQIRWTGYLQIMSLIPAVLVLSMFIQKVSLIKSDVVASILRVLTILAFLFVFSFIGISIMLIDSTDAEIVMTPDALEEFCYWMNDNEMDLGSKKTILTFLDFGPEILYLTKHSVISTPYHRNDEGILYNYEVMTSDDEIYIRDQLKNRNVNWILIAPNSAEKIFYEYDTRTESFYRKLLNNKLPIWLKEIELPEEHYEFKLYIVNQESL